MQDEKCVKMPCIRRICCENWMHILGEMFTKMNHCFLCIQEKCTNHLQIKNREGIRMCKN